MIYSNDPYTVLGIAENSNIEVAKQAYRKLAMEHHPDRGGDETTFKNVKAAWEKIEAGYTTDKPFRSAKPQQKYHNTQQAKSTASGYNAYTKPPTLAKTIKIPGTDKYQVTLEITEEQGFRGGVISFNHQGHILQYEIRAGSVIASVREELFRTDEMIGSPNYNRLIPIQIKLNVLTAPKEEHTPPSNMNITVELCALGLFTGGKFTVKDAFDKKVSISLAPGYNPLIPIIIEGKGYGSDKRGNIIVKINPIFKVPSQLTALELKQLQKLNEMTK